MMSQNSREKCPCCWNVFSQDSPGIILPCFHRVCESCMKFVKEKSGSKMCPLCLKVFQSFNPTTVPRQRPKVKEDTFPHHRHTLLETLPWHRTECTVDKIPHQTHRSTRDVNSLDESLNKRSSRLDEFLTFHLNAIKDVMTTGRQTLSGIETDIEDYEKLKKSFLRCDKQLEDIIKECRKHQEANKRRILKIGNKSTKLRSYLCATEQKLSKIRAFSGKLELVSCFQEAALVTDQDPYIEVSRHLDSMNTCLKRDKDKQAIYQQISEGQKNKLEVVSECILCPEEKCDEDSDEEVVYEVAYEEPPKTLSPPACCVPKKLMAHRLRVMDHALKYHIIQGNVFAVQKYKTWDRFARLYLSKEGELLLGHLQETDLPPSAFVVQYSEVMASTDPTTNEMFIELRNSTSSLGRLYIKALSKCTRARHFQLLCTGEMGDSYANSRLLEVRMKGDERLEAVRCGDYENKDGTGGRALVPISNFPIMDRAFSTEAGTLAGIGGNGERMFAQFLIYTRRDQQRICSRSFASVSKGMNILHQAIGQHSHIGEVVIKECGIVLWSPKIRRE